MTYANVAATLALLFAMSGGAYAASKYLITSTKQIKPSVLKSLKGKAGANGPNGAAGPAGPSGPTGAAGAGTPGAQGPAGPQGAAGAKGESGTPGTAGKEGKEGSPWTAGGSLPSGKTETGTWSVTFAGAVGAPAMNTAISFPIPIKGAFEGPAHVFDLKQTEEKEFGTSGCTGTVEEPTAPKGLLCVYTATEELEEASGHLEAALRPTMFEGYGPSGTFLTGIAGFQAGSRAAVGGTWAVTAP